MGCLLCVYWKNCLITWLKYARSISWPRNIPQITWWRHQMEKFSALLAICAGNSPVPGEFPTQRPVTRSFDVFFDLRLNKRLSKQSWGWWLETIFRPLWRNRNECHGCGMWVSMSVTFPQPPNKAHFRDTHFQFILNRILYNLYLLMISNVGHCSLNNPDSIYEVCFFL